MPVEKRDVIRAPGRGGRSGCDQGAPAARPVQDVLVDGTRTAGRIIYLDNAATSDPKPQPVVEAVTRMLSGANGSPGRGAHRVAVAASRVQFEARTVVAEFLGVTDCSRLIFTQGATDALNAAIHGVLDGSDGVVLCSSYEHNAVWRPLRDWARRGGGSVSVVPPGKDAPLDLNALRNMITPSTRLVVLAHASNVTGEVLPVQEAADICRRAGVPLVIDAAQTAGHLAVPWDEIGAAAVVASGHKGLLGPQGVGVLALAEGFWPRPVRQGGTGGNSEEDVQPSWLPDRYESGTPNMPGIAGLGAAVTYLASSDPGRRHREQVLTARLMDGLGDIAGVWVPGSADPARRVGVVSFQAAGWDAGTFAQRLDEGFGVIARAGLHCAPLAHRTIGTFPSGTVRFSIGWTTSAKEIDQAVAAVRSLAALKAATACASF